MLSSCDKNDGCEDDQLSLVQTSYNGNELRIDGYYFGDVTENSDPSLVSVYYFYADGVFFTSESSELSDAEAGTILVDVENDFGKRIKASWGLFRVDSNLIQIERWQSRTNGCETTIYERGTILSDTTFVLSRREFRDNGEAQRTDDLNAMFKFRPLTEKPDSTNSFIP